MSSIRQFIHEVHRRSLWQVLLIYVGGSWVAFEVVQTLTEGLGLPGWFPALALVLLIVLLPVVLATAFVREAEPAATISDPTLIPVDEAQTEAARKRRLLTWRNAGLSFMAALAVWGIVATGWLLLGERGAAPEAERTSIAVLPFANLSPNADDAYFADGIHEEIISQLGKIASLKVISRTSVMEYRERDENLRTIADELGVTHVLEGSVRRADDRVRITTQLIAAREDAHLWAENYEKELKDVFGIQADVAQAVASALRARLTPEEVERIGAKPTENEEAYEYYLRGQTPRRGTRAEMLRAAAAYDTAVSLDPDFAAAWARLGRVRVLDIFVGFDDFTLEQAKQAIDRAVALDPDLPATQLALGFYYYWGLREYESALDHLYRVRRLEPSNAIASLAIGFIHRRQGRWEEAIAEFENAQALDPRVPLHPWTLGQTLLFIREYRRAESHIDRALALDPAQVVPNVLKVQLPIKANGDIDRARGELQQAMARAGESRILLGFVCDPRFRHYTRILSAEFDELLRDSTASEDLRSSCLPLFFDLKASIARARGQSQAARAYHDSALAIHEADLAGIEARPSAEHFTWRLIGIHAAQLGHEDKAIEATDRAVELLPVSEDAVGGPAVLQIRAEVYALTGEPEKAMATLDTLLSIPSYVSVPILRLDPFWDPLRDHARFQALLAQYE
ncbi:MAG: tetratricopeptide repeat protein [Gemmatimonadales bacterium]|jgi:TolB-like protein/cytochrome c-type biogenesis protein CcmH/NrfG